jgi:ribosomal protein S18 acetylase RimI-like enzyme
MITVVDISTDHVDSFRDAVDAVARERLFLARTEAPPREQLATFVQSNIDSGNPHVIALDGNTVVGWADIKRAGAPAMRHCGVLGMGVLAAYRGQGIGHSLLKAAIIRSWDIGLERIELEVRVDNQPAIALYESLGFRREGVKVCAMLLDGSYVDMLQMGLLRDLDALRSNISFQADRER